MTRLVAEALLPAGVVERVLSPRQGVVHEVPGSDAGRFDLGTGPYESYTRSVQVAWADDRRHAQVRQTVEYELETPWWRWLLHPPIRRELGRLVPARRRPWWLPPDTLDQRSMRMLCVLAVLALVAGYQNALMPQTLTYAVKQFHATNFAQSAVISVSRIDAFFALWMMFVADRRGRRIVLIQTVLWGAITSALGAAAPSLSWLAASQTASRSFCAASLAIITIYAAEEMPAGSRAYALGMLTAVGVIGAGFNVLLLSGVNVYGWRVIFALSIVGCAVVPACARQLPESKRFVAHPPGGPVRGQRPLLRNHMERLMLLVALGFLIQVFALPSTQFLNQFLRTERGFSPPLTTVFNVFTTIPGAIGLFGGGRLADRYGRKIVAGVSLVVGSAAMIGGYLTWGWEMWFFHMVAQIFGGALIPATAILGPEIFPTALRGRAYGVFTVAQGAGSVAGLLLVGWLSGASHFGRFGIPIALMGAGPVVMAFVLARFFPETAHRELEVLNPEDAPPGPSHAPPGTSHPLPGTSHPLPGDHD